MNNTKLTVIFMLLPNGMPHVLEVLGTDDPFKLMEWSINHPGLQITAYRMIDGQPQAFVDMLNGLPTGFGAADNKTIEDGLRDIKAAPHKEKLEDMGFTVPDASTAREALNKAGITPENLDQIPMEKLFSILGMKDNLGILAGADLSLNFEQISKQQR
jgi:hypothetical protein